MTTLNPVSSAWDRAVANPPHKGLTPLKAYLVEDNELIRQNLEETLTELTGMRMLGHASTENDACQWLAQHPKDWELLILDLFLLQGTGLGVLKRCEKSSPKQRVVVLSNYATDDIRSRCMACGADAVFDKSTQLDLLFRYCGSAQ